MMKIKKNMYVNELPKNLISTVKLELSKIGLSNKQIKIAMCSKICDLIETLPNIYDVLGIK